MRNAEGFLCVFFCTDFAGDTNCRRRVRPDGAESFSLNLSGELRSAERGDSPRPAAGSCADAARAHKRVDTCGFHPLVNHPFPLEGLAQIAYM